MNYATVCSGIEAPSMAWKSLGWTPQWFSEIEPFPSLVLSHHYPNVPNLGDMTKLHKSDVFTQSAISLLCGGTPCQSFSVAGLRKGLDDPRGNLMLTFLSLADQKQPRWLLWENVPGVLSSNGGRDFGAFLGGLAELGYGWAYRVLDAQYYGVAQRRRRVFVVGCLGDWRGAAAVLFERHSLQGHPAPSRKTGKRVTANATRSLAIRGRDGVPQIELGDTIANAILTPNGGRGGIGVGAILTPTITHCVDVAPTINSKYGEKQGLEDQHIYQGAGLFVASLACSDVAPTIGASGPPYSRMGNERVETEALAIAFAQNTRDEVREMDVVGALAAQPGMKQTSYIRQSMAVRRLTPTECEALQGFPRNYTDIRPKGKPTPDGPRYKALGNSMAVPVIHWIGQRIQMVDNLLYPPPLATHPSSGQTKNYD